MKKVLLIQSPSKFYDVVPIFYKGWNDFGFFDKFYIVTDFKGPYGVGGNCEIIKLDRDFDFYSNMIYAFPKIEEDVFLLCCEDHIRKDGNDIKKWNECYNKFIENDEMGFLRLTNTKNKVELDPACDDFICPIYRKYKYYISLQPSFWKKDYFKQALVDGEGKGAWEFETLGSKRARHHPTMKSFCVRDSVCFRTNFYKDGKYCRSKYIDYIIENGLSIDQNKPVMNDGKIMSVGEYIKQKEKG